MCFFNPYDGNLDPKAQGKIKILLTGLQPLNALSTVYASKVLLPILKMVLSALQLHDPSKAGYEGPSKALVSLA